MRCGRAGEHMVVGPIAGGSVPRCLLRSGRATKPPTKTGLPPACRREVRGEGARAATRALPRFPFLAHFRPDFRYLNENERIYDNSQCHTSDSSAGIAGEGGSNGGMHSLSKYLRSTAVGNLPGRARFTHRAPVKRNHQACCSTSLL